MIVRLPHHLISWGRLAAFEAIEVKEIVLRERVLHWIEENGITCEVISDFDHEDGLLTYSLVFDNPDEALLFKLRWF